MSIWVFPNVTSITDHYNVQNYLAPNGEMTAVPLYKLVGDSFGLAALDTTYWTPSAGVGGTVDVSGGQLRLLTGTTANNTTSCVSVFFARFSGLAPNKLRMPMQLPDTGVANNTRRWGVFDALNGAFFELSGTTFRCVTRKAGVDSQINSGSFNGQYGPTYGPGVVSHFFEIIYQPRQAVFLADNTIIHTLSASATTWTENLHLPIRMENNNSGGSTTNVSMFVRLATIGRFGISETQKIGLFQTGLTAGRVLKIGAGNLESVALASIGNNAQIIYYDNTAASGTVLFDSGAMPNNSVPLSLPFGGIAFNTGLTLVVSGASANVMTIFD